MNMTSLTKGVVWTTEHWVVGCAPGSDTLWDVCRQSSFIYIDWLVQFSLAIVHKGCLKPHLISMLYLPDKPVAIHTLAVCPRGKYIATGDLDGNVHIYSVKKRQVMNEW